MNAKKVLAMTLATAMVIGSSMTVLAEESSTTGTGALEDYVSTDVFQVVLPTESAFTFILDPQGLINATSAGAYTGKTFESGASLFFANTYEEGHEKTTGEYDYSSTSDKYTITNKSSMDVAVSVTATLTNYDGITVSTTGEYTETDTDPAMYFAFVVGITKTPIAETTNGEGDEAIITASATIEDKIEATDDAYEFTYANGSYDYTLKTTVTDFEEYTFQLTGSSNTFADWSDVKSAGTTPTVNVVWTVCEADAAAPSIATTNYSIVKDTAVNVEFDLGSGQLAATGISAVTYVLGETSGDLASFCSLNGTTLTISADAVNAIISANSSCVVTVTFNDDAATSVDITLAK